MRVFFNDFLCFNVSGFRYGLDQLFIWAGRKFDDFTWAGPTFCMGREKFSVPYIKTLCTYMKVLMERGMGTHGFNWKSLSIHFVRSREIELDPCSDRIFHFGFFSLDDNRIPRRIGYFLSR